MRPAHLFKEAKSMKALKRLLVLVPILLCGAIAILILSLLWLFAGKNCPEIPEFLNSGLETMIDWAEA